MKVRSGYVSNSSSSSFLVKIRDVFHKVKGITKEQIELLTRYGFKWVDGTPRDVFYGNFNIHKDDTDFKQNDNINLYYDSLCQEDVVSDFLFQHKIPFLASVHYDEWLWVYNGNDHYDIWPCYPEMIYMQGDNYRPEFVLRGTRPFYRLNIDPKKDKQENKKVFICSPYRGDVKHNLEMVKKYCRKAVMENCIPFAPHLYFTEFLDDNIESERSAGINAGLEILKMCDEVWVFADDKKLTEGMQEEVKFAHEQWKMVRYFSTRGKEEYRAGRV